MTRQPDFGVAWTWLSLTLCLGMPLSSGAQTKDMLPNSTLSPLGTTGMDGGGAVVTPFKYVPAPGAAGNEIAAPKRNAQQQRIADLNAAGNYQAISTEGVALLAQEKPDDELVLIIANSLAWTGYLKEAIVPYQSLANGPLSKEGKVGQANALRWMGRDDLAMPLYHSVLAADSGHADALVGQEQASRELSPRTRLSLGGNHDSSEILRRSATVNHRWRDKTGAVIMEAEASAVNDEMPGIQANRRDVTLRYENLRLALKPSLELALPNFSDGTVYGRARVKLFDDRLALTVGMVNWGLMSINPNALAAKLEASQVGVSGAQNFAWGTLQGRWDYYNISDGNEVTSGRLHLASAWRPLGRNYIPFAGVESRSAKFATNQYWSPQEGSGALYAGLMGEWGAEDWNLYASGQMGTRLYGDAGQSWSVSAGGKRWVSSDVALSLGLWSMASVRDGLTYRAQSAMLSLEKLWR